MWLPVLMNTTIRWLDTVPEADHDGRITPLVQQAGAEEGGLSMHRDLLGLVL